MKELVTYVVSQQTLGVMQDMRTLAARGIHTYPLLCPTRIKLEGELNQFDAIIDTMEHAFDDGPEDEVTPDQTNGQDVVF